MNEDHTTENHGNDSGNHESKEDQTNDSNGREKYSELTEEQLTNEIRATKRKLHELIFLKNQLMIQRVKEKQTEQQQVNPNAIDKQKGQFQAPYFQTNYQYYSPGPYGNYYSLFNSNNSINNNQFYAQYSNYPQNFQLYQQQQQNLQPFQQNQTLFVPWQQYQQQEPPFMQFDKVKSKKNRNKKEKRKCKPQFCFQTPKLNQSQPQQCSHSQYKQQQTLFPYQEFQQSRQLNINPQNFIDPKLKKQKSKKSQKGKQHRKCPSPPSWWYIEYEHQEFTSNNQNPEKRERKQTSNEKSTKDNF